MVVLQLLLMEQVKGQISYNGHKLNEFVPRKTSAYISQNDVHVGEMTVKETFDFSARCQGVGTRYGNFNCVLKLHASKFCLALALSFSSWG